MDVLKQILPCICTKRFAEDDAGYCSAPANNETDNTCRRLLRDGRK